MPSAFPPAQHRIALISQFILQEILRPFLLVCESKNPKLIGTVLGSIQKLLAHDAVSDEGRNQIIQALQQVRAVLLIKYLYCPSSGTQLRCVAEAAAQLSKLHTCGCWAEQTPVSSHLADAVGRVACRLRRAAMTQ
jgi:hypothetical protein